jgi:hypothetical protein
LPVPSKKLPELPELVVPVLNLRRPLTPSVPASLLRVTTAPLDLVVPAPLLKETAPPVWAEDLPECN